MQQAIMFEPGRVAQDTVSLMAYLPVPGFGVLPVNSFVIQDDEPILVDTGLAALADDYMKHLRSVVNPETLKWIWLTHTDPDHLGNIRTVLQEAPQARVVTNYLGMGKMGLLQLPTDRVYLLNPGQRLQLADRELKAVTLPSFDAPETMGLFDNRTQTLFSADCFGALMAKPAETAGTIDPTALREGCIAWSMVDAPWLNQLNGEKFDSALKGIADLEPTTILSAHLPPAAGMTRTLLSYLSEARNAEAFVGPDQAMLENMMASQASVA